MAETQGTIAPYRRLNPLEPGAVRWTTGFWGSRFEQTRTVTLPSMRAAMDDPTNGAVFSNFFVAASLQEGAHLGTNWSDGDCYKWMEAVAHTYGIIRDPELDETLDALIDVIAQAQEDDGYISTQTQLDPDKGRCGMRRYHELYNMGHLMTAAAAHHRVTGKETFLQIAQRAADYVYELFAPRPRELTHFPWNPSNIMGLIDLYRETGEVRYRDLADIFVSMRGSEPWPSTPLHGAIVEDPDPGDQNQDRVPLREESDAVGHAVTATYLYAGAADVYAETGDPTLLAALERIWHSSAERKMYVTGAVGAYHQGVSKRGDRVHEAYGLDYELPNATAYNETCANIGNAMWAWRMVEITGEARYADVMERVVYNSGLSGISIDGTRFCYTNPLRWYGAEHEALSHDTQARWQTHDCYCCPPQVARTLAGLHNWAYSLGQDDDGSAELWIHLFGSNRLEMELAGAPLRITQSTNYPWGGRIVLVVRATPSSPWTLRLRVPAWAEGAHVRINGARRPGSLAPGAYAAIERAWSSGDIVELVLPMEARLIQAHPRVEAARNQVAVMRGPLVYCLESIDLPQGVDLDEVALPEGIVFTPWYDRQLLNGVVALEGEALRRPGADAGRALYRPLEARASEPIAIQMIPYYAWNNRGTTEMTVWLPRA